MGNFMVDTGWKPKMAKINVISFRLGLSGYISQSQK